MTRWFMAFLYCLLITGGIFLSSFSHAATDTNIQWETPPQHIAHITVFKSKRLMQLLDEQGNVITSYRISLGQNPIGHKEREGDGRTPEGRYKIDFRNSGSRFYRSLRITYPNQADKARARQNGQSPGGDIFIHGEPNKREPGYVYPTGQDWTDGCIAVTNKEMDELWNAVNEGTTILIRP